MKTIIIGSQGFIGQHLFNHFQEKGFEVWGADVHDQVVQGSRYFRIDPSIPDFTAIFKHSEFDLCVNCSGAASVPESLNNPLKDYFLNTVNVFRILESIKKFQSTCRFINLSSAAVYGNPQRLPIYETDINNPLSPYGIHKLHAEEICKEFYEFYGIKTCSLRIFSAYGVGLRKQLFWDLYQKVKRGTSFELFGTGNESRDFINILDLVRAIELVVLGSDFKADIINIANGKEVLIKDAVSTFFSFFKEEIKYSFSGDSRRGDPVNWLADVSKLKTFGYKTSIEMAKGLEMYFKWIRGIDY